MRIAVKIKKSETQNEIYEFNVFDFQIVFVSYYIEEKPKGKRVWKKTTFWDKYQNKTQNKIDEPILTENIRIFAKEEFIKYISVMTWSEYKKQ